MKNKAPIAILAALTIANSTLPAFAATSPHIHETAVTQGYASFKSSLFFPRYTGSSSSIVTALNSLGVNSSYDYRSKIAAANGISDYRGSSSQNLTMLSLLKQGLLKKPGSGTPVKQPLQDQCPLPGSTLSVTNKARENGILYSSSEGERSASQLDAVIDQYCVDSNSRYAKKGSSTYCNIFVWDVTRALNAEIPHWLKNNRPATSHTSGAHEINANGTVNWLRNYGENHGWYKTSAKEAQSRANAGYPTVAIWKNPKGHGHVAIVRPEGSGYYYSSDTGPVIAQAGSVCTSRTSVYSGFGGRLGSVEYFTHD